MKKKSTLTRFNRTISALLFFMVVISGSAMAQWTAYNGSAHPLDHQTISFTRSNVSGVTNDVFDSWSTIVNDNETVGNQLLQFVDNAAGQRGMWRVNLPEGSTKLTLVTRVKAQNLDLDWTLDLDVDFGGIREQFFLMNDNTIRVRRGTDLTHDFPEGFEISEWNTYRFVFDTEAVPKSVKVYLNESETPFIEAVPATAGTNMYFRFGNGDQNKTVSFLMDWMIWDLSGAYAPGEGDPLPSEFLSNIWRIYDANVMPDVNAPAFVTSSGSFSETENAIIDDAAIEGNKLLEMDVLGDPNTQFYWRMKFDNYDIDVENLTVVMRVKGHAERDMALDLDMHYNDIRARISLFNTYEELNNVARIRNGEGENTALSVNIQEWNIYRFTMTETEVKLYVNENATPELIFTPQSSTSSNRHFRFGDGDSGNSFGADIDWVIWDVDGAFAPGEGAPIPDPVVTPSNDVTLATFDLGGESVLETYELEVNDPEVDNGGLLYVADFNTFAGIDLVPTNENANVSLTLNGEFVSEANFASQTFAVNDVIVVTVVAEDRVTITNYKITLIDREVYSEAEIVVFVLDEQLEDAVIESGETTGTVSVTVAYGTDITALTPSISVSLGANIVDYNSTSTIDFTDPVDFTVIAENGFTKVWTATVTVEPNDVATLADLLVDAISVEGFDPAVFEYDIELPANTTVVPEVTAVATDENALVEVTQAPELPGTAIVLVTAEDGITELEYSISFTVATSAGFTELSNLKLYPNPATTSITLEMEDGFEGADLKVICTTGRLMLQKRIESSNEVIDISNLMPGMYIIQVVNNNKQARKLFIKQ